MKKFSVEDDDDHVGLHKRVEQHKRKGRRACQDEVGVKDKVRPADKRPQEQGAKESSPRA